MKSFNYARPRSLAEASSVLSELSGKGKAIAGGTGLVPSLNHSLYRPQTLVDLGNVEALRGIRETASGDVWIGATTRLYEVSASELLRSKHPVLADAAGKVASYQIRSMATIGGNICLDSRCWYYNQSTFWRKSYPDCRKVGGNTCYVVKAGSRCYALMSSDLAPLLVAMGAKLEVYNTGSSRLVAVEDLFTGDGARPNNLGPGDVLAHVILPKLENTVVSFNKYSLHPPVNFGLVTLAVAITTDPASKIIQGARLVYGCVDSAPVRCLEAESAISGTEVGQLDPAKVGAIAGKEITVYSSVNAGQAYKRQIIEWQAAEALWSLIRTLQAAVE